MKNNIVSILAAIFLASSIGYSASAMAFDAESMKANPYVSSEQDDAAAFNQMAGRAAAGYEARSHVDWTSNHRSHTRHSVHVPHHVHKLHKRRHKHNHHA